MRKILLATIVLVLLCFNATAQCLVAPSGLFPSTTFTPTCTGNPQNITTAGWAGEYSNVNVVTGSTYTFTSSVATDFITISNSGGTTAFTFGVTPVTWTSTLTGVIRFYTHLNSACGSASISRTRAVSCTNVACSAVPDAGTTSASSVNVCSGNTTNLTLSGATSGQGGLSYQWQSSPDDVTYTSITGATNSGYLATITASAYYRAILTCGNAGGGSDTSAPILVNVVLNVPPAAQPTALILTPTASSISGSFTAVTPSPTGYLVVRTPTNVAPVPVNGTVYAPGPNAIGFIESNNTSTTFNSTALSAGTYYYWVFAYNNTSCPGGPTYNTVSPLTGSATLLACANFSGTKTVGPTGDYASLTAAVNAINSNGINGPVVLELQATYTSAGETFPIVLSNYGCASATNTVTIRPAAGASALSITGDNPSAIFDINGGKYWQIDGRPGGTGTNIELSITNTSSQGVAIRFINGASFNTVTYADVMGQNTATSSLNPSGVIYFSTAGINGVGNSNNTISYSNIHGPSPVASPSMGISAYGTNTSLAAYNEFNTITNCSIYDYFIPNGTSNGMKIDIGNSAWTITNNSFYQRTTRTYTTGTTHRGIWVTPNTLSINNTAHGFVITGNFIGGTAVNAGGSPYTMSGTVGTIFLGMDISVGIGAATSIQNNTIQNIALTTSSAGVNFIGIHIANGTTNVGTVTGNTIGSPTVTNSISVVTTGTGATAYGIRTVGGTIHTISNNKISGFAVGGAGTISMNFTGIHGGGGTTNNIINNIVGSATVANSITLAPSSSTTAQQFHGILINSGTASEVSNNTIANISNAYTGTSTSGVTRGITVSATTGSINNNSVFNLRCTNAQATVGTGSAMMGILMSSTSAGGMNIIGNTIHSLTNAAASTTVASTLTGIYFGGTTVAVSKINGNFIHSLEYTAANPVAYITGMDMASGFVSVANNMIRLGIRPDGSSISDATIVRGISCNSTGAVNNYYHNSIYIGGTVTATNAVNTFAFNRTTTSGTYDIRNNILVNNRSNATTGGKHLVFNFTTNMTGVSINSNVYQYTGTGGVFAYNGTADVPAYTLGWNTSDLQSIVADPLFVNPTGTAATVDLHVQTGTIAEGTGVLIPSITDDFDGQTRSTLSPVDIGADAGDFGSTGIDVGANGIIDPVIGGCSSATQTISVRIKNYSLNPIDFATNNVTVNVTATGPGTPYSGSAVISTGTLASGATMIVTISPLIDMSAAGTYTITATTSVTGDASAPNNVVSEIRTVSSGAQLSGSYNVGVGQSATGGFETLTAAVAAYNTASCLAGNVIFNLTDAAYNTAETFPIVINGVAGSNTLTIKPAAGVTSIITGSATTAVIKLNGADNVIIDGSNNGTNSQNLTINQTSGSFSAHVIWINSVNASNGANNNTIKNLIVKGNSQTVTSSGIMVSGSSTGGVAEAANNNILIQNNAISKTVQGIVVVGSALAQTGTQILNNTIGSTINGESINYYGMQLTNLTNALVSGNTIMNIKTTSTNPAGLNLNANVSNTIVDRNTITSIHYTGVSGYGGKGINVNPNLANANITISNNMISDIRGDGWNSLTNDGIVGIRVGANASTIITAGNIKIYNNTVNLGSGSFAGAANGTLSGAIYLSSGTSNLDIRNNIFVSNLVNTAAATAKTYAIVSHAPLSAFTNIDFNNYYVSGTQGVLASFNNVDVTTLAGIQAAFGGNMNSQVEEPIFVSPTDLHMDITANFPLNNTGTPLPGITMDFDGDARSATTPDKGADEFDVVTGIDLGAISILTPVIKNCYSPTETVTVRIRNLSANPHNFSLVPATVSASVSGPNPVTFAPVIVNTGILAPGDTLDVVITTTYNMSAYGSYTFDAFTTVAADVTPGNNAMDPVVRTLDPIEAGILSSDYNQFCLTGTPVLTVTGSNGTIQWQEALSATGPWTNVGTGTNTYSPAAAITVNTYFRVISTCNTNSDTTAVKEILINAPALLTTTPATRCGPGTVDLTATGSAGTSFNWYAGPTGGAPIATTATFTTPILNNTTTYYVSAAQGGGSSIVGLSPTVTTCGAKAATGATDWPLRFNTTSPITLNSAMVIPNAAGNFTVALRQSLSTVNIQTATFSFTAAQVGVPQTINLGWAISASGSYQLTNTIGGGYRIGTFTCAYPFVSAYGGLQIVGSATFSNSATNTNTYNIFYNLSVSEGCETPRQSVVATVNPGPAFTVIDSFTICNNASQALSVTSPVANYDNYIWTPATNLYTDAAGTVAYTGGSASTVYVKTATPGTYTYRVNALNNGSGCTGIDSIKVTVLPGGVTVAASPSQICVSGQSSLSLNPATGYTGAQFQWQSSPDGTTYTDIAGATSQNYITPVISSTTHYRVVIKNNSGVSCEQPSVTINVNSPSVLTTTPAALCGPGIMTLNATGSTGTTLNWYNDANGGASIGTGGSFTTPNLTATDTFYVSATSGGALASAGPISVNSFPGKQTSASFTQGMIFDVLSASANIQSVDIFPTTPVGTNFQIVIRQFSGSGAVIATYQGTTTVTGTVASPVAQTVPVNFNLPGGFDYVMTFYNGPLSAPLTGNGVYPGALRNNPATGVSFPYAIPNELSITATTNANTWNYFYNWRVGTGCESPRIPVIAQVSVNTAITSQPVAQSICSGASFELTIGAVGAGISFQWKKDGVDIPGATNDTLTINNATTANAGVYTVAITGLCGNVTSTPVNVAVSPSNGWIGITSTDWNTSSNWCGGIPTETSDVVIPSGTPYAPVIVSIATVRNLTISSGATVTLLDNGFLNIHGTYSNSGTFTAPSGYVAFKGSTNQTVAAMSVGNVIINGTGGVTLGGDMTITNTLILENGNLTIGAHTLTLNKTSTGTVASHIITGSTGSVVTNNVTSATTVPVGPDAASYNPVTINNGQGRNYTVRVATGINPSVPVPGVAVNRTWNITPSSAVTSQVQLTFQYADTHMNNPGSPVATMQVGAHNGTAWNVVSPASGLVPVGGNTSRRVTTGTTSFGPMVVTNIGGINIPTSIPNVDPDVTKTVLMPNLVNHSTVLRVKATRATRIDWVIVDMQGRVMMTFYRQVPAGTTDIPLDVSRFTNGHYLLSGFTSKGKLEVLRFIKM